jgi:tetratricopeptide (TPR) repeat protein
MMLSVRTIAMLVLAFSLHARNAAADPAAEKEAKRLYDKGTKHFNLGEYDAAITAYKDAYRAFENPYFLFNIAQASRLAGDNRQALTFYKSFLNAAPDAPERPEVTRRIAELEALIREEDEKNKAKPVDLTPREPPKTQDTAKPLPPPPPPPQPETSSSPIYSKWWFWAGVGVIAVGAGVVTYAATRSESAPSTDLGNFQVMF